jgi:hypothetical protein
MSSYDRCQNSYQRSKTSQKSALGLRSLLLIAVAGLAAVGTLSVAIGAGPKPKLGTPTISCSSATPASITLQVCGGATGAPAGFSIQWMTLADFTANGGWYSSDDPRLCKASFSGNANDSRYILAAGACVEVEIGDFLFDNGASTNCASALHCGTTYVFHSFAHATNSQVKSDWTPNLTCATQACPETCYTLSQGYFRNHVGFDDLGAPVDFSAWPASIVSAGGLQIGNNFYDLVDLYHILLAHGTKGNQLPQLAHQVIAVEFSVAIYGWAPDTAEQQACLEAAHDAIGSLDILTGTLSGVGDLIDCLDTEYIQAFHCDDQDDSES